MQKAPPPKPTIPPMTMKAKTPSLTKTGGPAATEVTASTKALGDSAAKEKTLAPSTKGSTSSPQSVQSVTKTESTGATHNEKQLVADDK
jgi:ubiquinol-cytochrome c reductase cytochrome b subunit